jgi:predicted Zn finger-like uncharacterized protein
MEQHLACPHCHTGFKAHHEIPRGKAIRCPRCGKPFAVTEAVGHEKTLVAIPYQAPARRPVSLAQVIFIAVGLLAVTGGGVGLAIYCFSLPADEGQVAEDTHELNDLLPASSPPEEPASVKSAAVPQPVIQSGSKGSPAAQQAPKVIHHAPKPAEVLPGQTPAVKTSESSKTTSAPTTMEDKWVNDAITKGVAYLRRGGVAAWLGVPMSSPGDDPTGYLALVGLTLLECGVAANDRLIQDVRKQILARVGPLDKTYALSLTILFLNRMNRKDDDEMIQTLATRLVAGQNPDGGWGYICPVLTFAEKVQLLRFLRRNRLHLRDLIRPETFADYNPLRRQTKPAQQKEARPVPQTNQSPASVTQPAQESVGIEDLPLKMRNLTVVRLRKVTPFAGQNRSDNSNSQFAILGLWVAQHYDMPMERTLNLVDQRYRSMQARDGGWPYLPGPSTPDMTCAGLLGLAVGHGSAQKVAIQESDPRRWTELKASDAQAQLHDAAIQKALGYLSQHIGPPMPRANMYFLWSVQRVAVLFGLQTIGGKDWYEWGAKIVVAEQNEDGSWFTQAYPGSTRTADTCFALLFLKRANFVPRLTEDLRFYVAIQDPTRGRK